MINNDRVLVTLLAKRHRSPADTQSQARKAKKKQKSLDLGEPSAATAAAPADASGNAAAVAAEQKYGQPAGRASNRIRVLLFQLVLLGLAVPNRLDAATG